MAEPANRGCSDGISPNPTVRSRADLLPVFNVSLAVAAVDQPIIVTTSANLTKSGWCSNLEAAHLLEVPGH